jgi:hypothetical protein
LIQCHFDRSLKEARHKAMKFLGSNVHRERTIKYKDPNKGKCSVPSKNKKEVGEAEAHLAKVRVVREII